MAKEFRRINLSYVPLAKELANVAIFGAAESSTGSVIVYDQESTDTGSFVIPAGNTDQRGNVQVTGALRFNNETNYLEIYYTNTWVQFMYFGYINATGGTITTDGDYRIHTFANSGTFVVLDAPEDIDKANTEYLIIGGGGAGGGGSGGSGAGAGGMLETYSTLQRGSYAVVVGAGGAPTTAKGSDSSVNSLIGYGGGGGESQGANNPNKNGGSGGGRAGAGSSGPFPTGAGTGISGQGYPGGGGHYQNSNDGGGGGGGAGGAGGNAAGNTGGNGGPGRVANMDGVTYAGGGGGNTYSGNPGDGGSGGGGEGARGVGGYTPTAGQTNTGGGGGGANTGGSGIVKIKYRFQ